MLKQFAQKIEDMMRLIDNSRSASFLLAVSGGMDSMCMLDLFGKVLPVSDFAVAHCNFSLRSEESDGDQALVEARAAELGIRLFVRRFDTVAYARKRGVSIEMAARELRYSWFGQLCSEHGFDVLAVAHNANDNAETLVLNLLRGTGLKGLHGMGTVTDFSAKSHKAICQITDDSLTESGASSPMEVCQPNGGKVLLHRPLLEFTRKQIEGYVLAHRIPYRHDSSNSESDYKRNRIRNEVFPIFEKINPSFVRTLNREIGYFAEAGSIVEDWCRSQLPNVLVANQEEGRTVSLPKLLAIPHWRYLLYYILEPYGFNSQTIVSIESLLDSDRTVSGKRFESPTHTLLTTRDSLIVVPTVDRRHSSGASRFQASESPAVLSAGCPDLTEEGSLSCDVMVVRGAGIYNFNGSRFSVELLGRTPDMPLKQPFGTLILDADTLPFPFLCRRWRQGDWLIPLGMRGKKKVSDLFADLKFTPLQKDASVLLVDTRTPDLAEHQHVAGLLGVRIDDRYKIAPSTCNVLRITLL